MKKEFTLKEWIENRLNFYNFSFEDIIAHDIPLDFLEKDVSTLLDFPNNVYGHSLWTYKDVILINDSLVILSRNPNKDVTYIKSPTDIFRDAE